MNMQFNLKDRPRQIWSHLGIFLGLADVVRFCLTCRDFMQQSSIIGSSIHHHFDATVVDARDQSWVVRLRQSPAWPTGVNAPLLPDQKPCQHFAFICAKCFGDMFPPDIFNAPITRQTQPLKDLQINVPIGNAFFFKLPRVMKRIQHFCVTKPCPNIIRQWVSTLFTALPNVKSCRLVQATFNGCMLDVKPQLCKLQSLELVACSASSPNVLAGFLARCECLSRLTLKQCKLDLACFQVLKRLPALKHLVLQTTTMTQVEVDVLRGLSLKSLSLTATMPSGKDMTYLLSGRLGARYRYIKLNQPNTWFSAR